MNATTRPRPAASSAISKPTPKVARREVPPANACAGRPSMVQTMDPARFPALEEALGKAQRAIWFLQDGLKLLDVENPDSIPFLENALTTQVEHAMAQLEIAEEAARAIAPRISHEAATWRVVEQLVREGEHEVSDVEMPALVKAYTDEVNEAGENGTSCGVILDRALRRMKAPAAGGAP